MLEQLSLDAAKRPEGRKTLRTADAAKAGLRV